jgi:Leucine-rich repeat (LRR) protein
MQKVKAKQRSCTTRYSPEYEILMLSDLETFDVASNQLYGKIPDEWLPLLQLHAFDISGNELSGPLDLIARFPLLESLDLSNNNQFTGNIPYYVGGLIYLNDVNLSDNSFDGTMPFSMGLLTNLMTTKEKNSSICSSSSNILSM